MLTPTDKAAIEGLIELGNRMRAVDKAAAAAWNQPTDTEHDRLSLEADKLFEEFAHASEAALPALQRLLAGETREADKPAGVLRAQLESHIEKMLGDYITWGSPGPLYGAGWSAACKYWAKRLSVLIKSPEDPHHG